MLALPQFRLDSPDESSGKTAGMACNWRLYVTFSVDTPNLRLFRLAVFILPLHAGHHVRPIIDNTVARLT